MFSCNMIFCQLFINYNSLNIFIIAILNISIQLSFNYLKADDSVSEDTIVYSVNFVCKHLFDLIFQLFIKLPIQMNFKNKDQASAYINNRFLSNEMINIYFNEPHLKNNINKFQTK